MSLLNTVIPNRLRYKYGYLRLFYNRDTVRKTDSSKRTVTEFRFDRPGGEKIYFIDELILFSAFYFVMNSIIIGFCSKILFELWEKKVFFNG